MKTEIWKEIPGHPMYQISSSGRVWTKHGRERELKQSVSAKGYHCVGLRIGDGYKNWRVHRLVMLAFRGESRLQVNHLDGNKSNNFLSNLEYATASQNQNHCSSVLGIRLGSSNPRSRLSEKQVRDIFKMARSKIVPKLIAQEMGVTASAIRQILSGKVWKHLNLSIYGQ